MQGMTIMSVEKRHKQILTILKESNSPIVHEN